MPKRTRCKDCGTPSQTNYLGLCEQCASNPVIVEEKIRARQITKEIRDGLPGFYEELRNATKTTQSL